MVFLFAVLAGTHWIIRYLKPVSLYIIRKFFGVGVLAIAVQRMFGNLIKVLHPSEDVKATAPVIATTHVDAISGNVEGVSF